MKPILLTIEGLKSVAEEQTIDFAKLSEGGVFGIFGKTGSGKSTILDAIVLALYGEIVSGKVNNRDFVNVGCMQTRVKLIFSVNSGIKSGVYGIERVYKFNKTRTELTRASAKLWRIEGDVEYPEADNGKELDEKIQNEIIGLKKDDFLKCIALPQGEFAAFVKLSRGERLKVIGKLFDLEKYGAGLQVKINAELSVLEAERIRLSAKTEQLSEYTPEKMEKLKAELDESLAKRTQASEIKKELEKKADGAKLYLSVKKNQDETDELLRQKSANKSIIEVLKKDVELYDRVKSELADVPSAVKLAKEIAEKENDRMADSERIVLLEKRKTDAEKAAGKIPEAEKSIAELKLKREKINEVSEKVNELGQKKAKLKELREAYNAAKKKSEENDGFAKKHEAALNELKEKTKAVDDDAVLKRIVAAASRGAVSELAEKVLSFISELENLLKGNVASVCENAVNRLIAREIEDLKNLSAGFSSGADFERELSAAADMLKEKNRFLALMRDESEKYLRFKNESEKAAKEAERLTEEGKKTREESDLLEKTVFSVTDGKKAEDALEETESAIRKKESEISSVRESLSKVAEGLAAARAKAESDEKRIAELKERLDELRRSYEGALNELGLDEKAALQILTSSEKIEISRKKIAKFDEDLSYLIKKASDNAKKLAEMSEFSSAEAIIAAYSDAEKNYSETDKYYNKILYAYEIGLKKSEEWCIIVEESGRNDASRKLYGKLAELVKAGKFMEFVADEYLREVAADAERRVLELTSGRYGLVYDGEFFVTDNLSGGKRRPVAGLSGGETFLVSLSLALALAAEIGTKALIPNDFFFLDEGFGTLDDELVETVTDSLERLRREDLTVGLITHVTELKNRIQSSLTVIGADAFHGTRFIAD